MYVCICVCIMYVCVYVCICVSGGEQEEVGEEEEELDAGRSVKEGGSNSRHGNPWLSNSGEESYPLHYVHTYMCACMCTYVHVYVRMYMCTYVHVYVCTCVRMYMCMYVGQGTNEERDKTHGSLSGKRAGLHVSRGVIDTGSFIVAEGGEGLGVASKQLLAVREAFAGDNVVEEFEREKAELESRETQVDAPVILPGDCMFVQSSKGFHQNLAFLKICLFHHKPWAIVRGFDQNLAFLKICLFHRKTMGYSKGFSPKFGFFENLSFSPKNHGL